MTGTPGSTALERTLDLVRDAPATPDTREGYLDLLGASEGDEAPGRIQRLWQSGGGSAAYDLVMRFTFHASEQLPRLVGRRVRDQLHVSDRLQLGGGEIVLDLGCGPGNITRDIARATGRSGLVIGLDASAAMLRRAFRADPPGAEDSGDTRDSGDIRDSGDTGGDGPAATHLAYVRADATHVPFRDGCFDAVSSSLALQLVPRPRAALTEMLRLLKPGGRLALTAPAAAPGPLRPLTSALGWAFEAHFFPPGELAAGLEAGGATALHDRSSPTVQMLDARKPA